MSFRHQIEPDEIFIDSTNLPQFNVHQFEGRLEKPIKKTSFHLIIFFFALVLVVFGIKVADLQVVRGEEYAEHSLNNTLRQIPIFAERGVIKDRRGTELAWNDVTGRLYIDTPGFSHVVGYIGYPTEEDLTTGKYHPKELIGRIGIERSLSPTLEGGRGIKIEEIDVSRSIVSEHIVREPTHGDDVELAIDAGLQAELHRAIAVLIAEGRFIAGAGVFMDIHTGEILAMTNVPEYDSNVLSRGADREKIAEYLNDENLPFLHRAVRGLYTPGSIVKPFMALAALNEGIISPEKQIYSSGAIRVANPYQPGEFSVFRDWKAHGWVDMRRALAVSSNTYFQAIGGGLEDQKGIGISNINKYAELFGFGRPTGIDFEHEEVGLVPSPEWKAKTFDGEPWRLGDTYHTVIGQYGFQTTPLQVVRAVGGLATGGKLVQPTLLRREAPIKVEQVDGIAPEHYRVVQEGMRQGVTEGTAMALSLPAVRVAAKTGTAELGVSKDYVNSWTIGYFPYDRPRYAFAVVMERGARTNLIGASAAMRPVLEWMAINTPEYFSIDGE